MTSRMKHWVCILIVLLIRHQTCQAQFFRKPTDKLEINNVQVACDKDTILVTLELSTPFEGLVYPKGLAKNSTCMSEYVSSTGDRITYRMPLWSCNTMSNDVEGGVEYFNTIVVQPHRRLVTNNGKGFHVRCKYHTKEKLILNNMNVTDVKASPIDMTVSIPAHMMKIFVGAAETQYVAENVNIGDNLTMHVALENQTIYGMKVTDCYVRDGLNWNEQQLINTQGCPVDRDLMGPFKYGEDKNEARVDFKAHKFPYTPSIYYKCNIKLCRKIDGGCDDVPPLCTADGRNLRMIRLRRQAPDVFGKGNFTSDTDVNPSDLSVAVYSGLHVEDPEELQPQQELLPTAQPAKEDAFCMSTRDFAIGIAIAGLILMLAVLLLVALLIRRRRRRKDVSTAAGSSIYSGPYTNPGYSTN